MSSSRCASLLVLALLPVSVNAQTPERLTHVASLGVPASGPGPLEVTPSPTGLVLFAGTDTQGTELWVTDLTSGGTERVQDIQPGDGSSLPINITALGSAWLFSADDGSHGRELWRSDGSSSGTRLVKDIRPGVASSDPGYAPWPACSNTGLAPLGGVVLFLADDGVHGTELWRSDGTEVGTFLVKDVNPGAAPSGLCPAAQQIVSLGATAFFVADDGTHGAELWATDGTEAGTRLVKDTDPTSAMPFGGPSGLLAAAGRLFFSATGQLWTSDGTGAGTTPVASVTPGGMVAFGGRAFFAASSGGAPELWVSDGTAAGTGVVSSLGGGALIDLDVANDRLILFVANPWTELWVSDGTAAGTSFVMDLQAPPPPPTAGAFIFPAALTPAGGVLYFMFSGETQVDYEPWKTDGTIAGTGRIRDLRPGPDGSWAVSTGPEPSRHRTAVSQGRLVFAADDGTTGPALWQTDGTSAGTSLLRAWSIPASMAVAGDELYFVASDGASGTELWKTGQAPDVETMVKDIRPGSGSSVPSDLVPVGTRLYFTADDGASGRELWRTDGTEVGTFQVKDVRPGSAGSDPRDLTPLGGVLYFTADDGTSGRELWRSDGTEGGTRLVVDTNPGASSSNPRELTVSGGFLFFTAVPPYPGGELFRTDGSAEGERRLTDLNRSFVTIGLGELTDVTGTLCFATVGNLEGLWRSDGTEAGTYHVVSSLAPGPSHLTAVNGRLFFTAAASPDVTSREDRELWVSDGTAAGTRLVMDIQGGGQSSAPEDLTAVGDQLLFTADDGEHGREPWTSDGTPGGTRLVEDLRPGIEGSGPTGLREFAGSAFLAADDGTTGAELWTTDGTAAGTAAVADIQPGAVGSDPGSLTAGRDAIYFTADDGSDGRQVWRLPAATSLVVRPVAVVEGDGDAVVAAFPVVLLSPPGGVVTVDYATSDGSATAGTDYEATSGTLVFNAGETEHTIEVPIIGDSVSEADETFRLLLSNPSGAALAHASAEGRIKDDDGAILKVVIPGSPTGRELRFTAVLQGGALAFVTSPQTVDVSFVKGSGAWSGEAMSPSASPWLLIAPAAGAGPGTSTLGVVDAGELAAGTYRATVRFSGPAIVNAVLLDVSLSVVTASSSPQGVLDTPGNGATGLTGAIAVTGWALDDVEVTKVEIYRDPVGGEPTQPNGKVYVGDGTFVPGARPDVERLFADFPLNHRAGWGYMLLTYGLPSLGNGTYVLHAYAYDAEAHVTLLGSRTIGCSNATARKPFGTIDTPGQGGTVSGSAYVVFGWALTPQPAAIPRDGSTIWLTIDEQLVAHPVYDQYRADIASAFPGYVNSDGAVGSYVLDTTTLEDGIHTIGWLVTDDQGHAEGLGSRFFWVQN